jgi:hypothetical protein
MKDRIALSSAVFVALAFIGLRAAAAAPDPDEETATVAAAPAATGVAGSWVVRAEGSLVDMRDNWLGMPGPELGVTVGRDLMSGLSIELTGSARNPDSSKRSWSAMAAARAVILANRTGRHALTFAGGPMFELDHPVHGSLPFGHAELAYVYRSSFGLTALAGAGVNVALASSPYVEPPPEECPTGGDAIVWCFDFGPDAREIHAGDRTATMRIAVGWQF